MTPTIQPHPYFAEAGVCMTCGLGRLGAKHTNVPETMATPMTPVDAINGLCWAASRMNLHAFCAALGWPEDDYAEDKFREFQQAARLLGRFDNGVIDTLVRKGREGY